MTKWRVRRSRTKKVTAVPRPSRTDDARARLADIVAASGVGELFDRIVSILERARNQIVRSLNTQTVTAYWLIGREIVVAFQRGEMRARYGEHLMEELSQRLTTRFGKGFSLPNLKNFRQFYLTHPDRRPGIGSPPGSESTTGKSSPSGSQSLAKPCQTFHPMLRSSHHRALMRVENPSAHGPILAQRLATAGTRRQRRHSCADRRALHRLRLILYRTEDRRTRMECRPDVSGTHGEHTVLEVG